MKQQQIEKLAADSARVQAIAHIGNWSYRVADEQFEWSLETYRIFGRAPDSVELNFTLLRSWVHPDDRSHRDAYLRQMFAKPSERMENLRFRIIRPDGETRWVEVSFECEFDEQGCPVSFFGTLQDITSRLETEHALRRSEAHLKRAQAAGGVGIWEYDLMNQTFNMSDSFQRIHGMHCDSYPIEQMFTFVPPEEAKNIETAFNAALSGQSSYDITHRMIRQDNEEVRWVHARGELVRDQDGSALAVVGTTQDVTEQKIVEINLRESERRFRTVFNQQFQFMALLSPKGRVLEINDLALRATTTSRDNYIGKLFWETPGWRDLPEWRDIWRRRFQQATATQDPLLTEDVYQTLDGNIRYADAATTALRLPDGTLEGFIVQATDTTERRLAEQNLKTSEQRFRSIFEQAAVGVALIDSKTGHFIRINQRYCAMLGYRIEEMTEKKTFQGITHPDDLQAYLDNMQQLLAGEIREFTLEKRYFHKDGSLIPVNLTVSPIWHLGEEARTHIAVVEDITTRKQSEQAKQTSEFRYQSLFDNMSDGVVIYEATDEGRDFLFRDINRAGERISCVTRKQIIGQRVTEVFPGIRDMGLLEVFQRVWNTGIAENMPISSYKDERLELWVENHVLRLPSGEIVAIYNDSTERKQTLKEQSRLQRELAQARKMEALGQLTGGIAHDFNNMLAIILGTTELMRLKMPSDEMLQGYLESITTSGQRASDLVARMMAFSRKNPKESQPTPLLPMVKEFLKLSRSILPSSIELREHLFSVPVIMINPIEVQQVLMNLVINARDAMHGKGILQLSLDTVEISNHECSICHKLVSGHWVELVVQDTGPGIAANELPHLFEPFFTTKPVGEGTGMGLAVVLGIMQRAQGHIMLESPENGGAKFRLLFPIPNEDAASSDGEELKLDQSEHPSFAGKALVVDDEPMITLLLEELLASVGIQVTAFNSSIDALSDFNQTPRKFDLIVTDQTMPTLTGVEFVRAVRELNADVPIVVMTGYSADIDEQSAALLGINQVLNKPIDFKEFLKTLEHLLPPKKHVFN